ncbi:hypothetical protein [Pseudarthrobacter sp. LT1]|uniref:hypothetical protein n=1 Tax=Pseudarthrobacter sp. LT1 TaxID=3111450 RepID=UPI002D7A3AB5|nr:hypothetical protein [Pseudarthrobacter sp. LT1]WRT12512.1 hypothetical protein VIK36_14200 [Pseudarthrobacter sp. LT1]
MDAGDLAEEASRIRGMVASFDESGGNQKLLRTVVSSIDDVAKLLLERGAADPNLKAEIIHWVLRFRADRERLQQLESAAQVRPDEAEVVHTANSASARAQKRGRAVSNGKVPAPAPAPHTEVFDYDTTDPRTKNPFFVKKPRKVAPAASTQPEMRPSYLGSTRSALLFTKKLDRLRDDVRQAARRPRGSGDSILKARIAELYHARTTSLENKYHQDVADELNSFAKALGTTISSFRAAPGSFGYAPVPQELTFSKGGPVVSGGLPTLGRGHR